MTWSHVDEDLNDTPPLANPCLAARVRCDLPSIKTDLLDEKIGRLAIHG